MGETDFQQRESNSRRTPWNSISHRPNFGHMTVEMLQPLQRSVISNYCNFSEGKNYLTQNGGQHSPSLSS